MAFKLADLKDLVGFGVGQFVAVKGQDYQYEIEKKRLENERTIKAAEAAKAAGDQARSLAMSDTVRNVVFWTLTTIAGGVLVAVVLKAAGIK